MRTAADILVPTIVLGELLAGFALGSREAENRADLNLFLDGARVSIATHGLETAERYARIFSSLRSLGTPIPTNDLWIAASAMEHGAEILTADRHFQHVSQVMVRLLGGA